MDKFGVIVAYNLKAIRKNIGDYIQTLAAIQFKQEREIVYLDRDALNAVEGTEHIKTIMNGWYMLKPENFPPTANIIPLYVSFHLAPFVAKKFFVESTINHLRQYEPIGCRDINTMRIMKKHGIKAYFSGCLTLSLNHIENYSEGSRTNDIYIVDPYIDDDITFSPLAMLLRIMRFYYASVRHKDDIIRIANQIKKTTKTYTNEKALFKYATKIYSTYASIIDVDVLGNAIYEEHMLPMAMFESENDKYCYAQNLLKKYAKAKFVITSRIHCALPCLALETPVVFVSAKDMERKFKPTRPGGRLEGLLNLFRNVYVNNGKSYLDNNDFKSLTRITMNYDLKNKKDYLKYRNALIHSIEEFLKYEKS